MTWSPFAQIFELVRYGEFKTATDAYIKPAYMVGCFMVLTWIGLVSIKNLRRHVHIN